MSIKRRLERLELQTENKAEAPAIKLPPVISPEAWMALFSDDGPGWSMTYEQLAEWAVQHGY